MKRPSSLFLILMVLLVLPLPRSDPPAWGLEPLAESDLAPASPGAAATLEQAYGRLPLYFVQNDGQAGAGVDFYVQGSDKTIYFSPGGVTFTWTCAGLREPDDKSLLLGSRFEASDTGHLVSDARHPAPGLRRQRWAVKLDFTGANPNARPIGQDRTQAVISYFIGPQDQWHAGLPTYSRIVYHDLWPGIELAYYGTVNQLKYEFIVQPGVDPAQIRLAYRGAHVVINPEGQLVVATPSGGFEDDRPVAYQEINGQRVEVQMAYHLSSGPSPTKRGESLAPLSPYALEERGAGDWGEAGGSYSFDIGSYDPSRSLILDPAVLVYCGYIVGNGDEYGTDITLDGAGNAYVTGCTWSPEASFPVIVGPDLTFNGGTDAFVAKVRDNFTITGRITNQSGRPVVGVTVSAGPGVSTVTNSSGYYALTNLLASTYTLTPRLSGYIFLPVPRTVTVPPDATGQDFTGSVAWIAWLPLIFNSQP